VAHALDLIWWFLEAQGTGVRRGQPATWRDDDWSPSGGNPGLHSAYGLAQCEAAWFVRSKPRVQRVWAGLFGVRTDELITSFDGISLLRPSGIDASWQIGAGNFHIDGRRHEGGFDPKRRAVCQGLVNLLPTAAHKGGNVLVPRSHHRYHELSQKYSDHGLKPDTGDIIQNNPEEIAGAIKVEMLPGDALVWDDRTIHGNGTSEKEKTARGFCFLTHLRTLRNTIDDLTRQARDEHKRTGRNGCFRRSGRGPRLDGT
jgi:hypothetical protein